VLDWATMTHNPFDATKDTTTLYASDRDVFLFLVDNNVHNRLSVNGVSRIYTRAGHQAASAEDRAVTSRLATLSTALGAAVVVVSTIAVRPAPRYVWNASESVPIGLYRLHSNG
jgi:hypothetical protein